MKFFNSFNLKDVAFKLEGKNEVMKFLIHLTFNFEVKIKIIKHVYDNSIVKS